MRPSLIRLLGSPNDNSKMWEYLNCDLVANAGNTKGRVVMFSFRLANAIRNSSKIWRVLGTPYLVLYRVFFEWLMGIEIPPLTSIGAGLALHHGQGLVVNNASVIGAECTLRHGVTIGNKGHDSQCPVIADRVDIGANAIILGAVSIGEGAIIGAGTVITKDVPAEAVMVGNPARRIR